LFTLYSEDKHAAGENVANKTHKLSSSSGTKYRASERAHITRWPVGQGGDLAVTFDKIRGTAVVRRGGVCKTTKERIELVCLIS